MALNNIKSNYQTVTANDSTVKDRVVTTSGGNKFVYSSQGKMFKDIFAENATKLEAAITPLAGGSSNIPISEIKIRED